MPRRKISKEKREKIKELRNKENLTFQEISDKVGLSVGVVYKYSKNLENKESKNVKGGLNISPNELAKVLYSKVHKELGHYLIRKGYFEDMKKEGRENDDYQFLKEELEKFIEKRE